MATPTIVGSVTKYDIAASSTSDSHSYDAGSTGQNRILVWVGQSSQAAPVSTATYNGVSMTVGTVGSGDYVYQSYGYLIAPATGTNTLTLNYASQSTLSYAVFVIQDASDIDVVGGNDNPANSFTSITQAITTSVNNDFIYEWVTTNHNTTISFGDGTTADFATAPGPLASDYWIAGHNVQLTAGTYTGSASWGTTGRKAMGVVSFKYLAPAAGPANMKTYDTNVKANIKTMNTNPLANVKTFDTNA